MSSPIRILVLDDEPAIRDSMVNFLEDYEFEVTPAGTAEEALEILAKAPFDAAVVDIRLPKMDGSSMIAEAHKLQSNMRFLIHTGSVGYKLPKNLKKIGMLQENVFLKPLPDLILIVNAINKLMAEKERTSDESS
ncbi:MAG: response regulator [Desulfobacterales bacterium]|nr:response regulator [Desulfobacterales bacterium]